MCSATRLVAATCILPRLPGRVLHRAAGLFGEAEDLAGERREPPPSCSQRDPAPVADEQLVAELLAQRRDGDRDRRLGDLELGRGSLNRPVTGDKDERLELGESHLSLVRWGSTTITSGLSDPLGVVV